MKNIQPKGIMIMKSYYEAINDLDDADQLIMFKAIMEYGFNEIDPTFDKKYLNGYWKLIEPTLTRGLNSYKTKVENGNRGGRPSKSTLIQPQTPKVDTKVVLKEKIQPEVNKGVITPIQSNLIIYTKEKIKNDEYQEIFTNLIMNGDITTIKEIEDELLHLT
jgi:hypothetical protein